MSTAYALNLHDTTLAHWFQRPKFLRDVDRRTRRATLDVHVRSGDYFVTLATVLDLMSQELPGYVKINQETLQTLVDDLLYLQQNYVIAKKPSSKRAKPTAL